MASYPGPKVHRVNRRKLGKGQYPTSGTVTPTLSLATTVLTITFSRPVLVSGIIPVTNNGSLTISSQTVVSPTVVTQTMSATGVGHTFTLPPNPANVSVNPAGMVAGTSASF
jgi:hypothetical protein